MYKQSHIPTVVQVSGGGGIVGSPLPPWVFALLQYFANVLSLIESF